MKVSGTVLLCVTAVCAVVLGVLSGAGVSGRMSGIASVHEGPVEIAGVLEEVGRTRSGRQALTLSLCGEEFTGENTIVYMTDTSAACALPGDTVRVTVKAVRVANFTEGFDYVKYMARRRVFFTCFQRGAGVVSKVDRPGFRYRVRRMRALCIAALRQTLSPLKPDNSALLVAFLSGDRENIRRDTLDDFRESGLMHLLALSGLHVGIIYSIMNFLFSIFGSYTALRKVRSLAVILCLWPYALLAGMGTSIFRAVVMATVYEGAVILERERSSLNALAASAAAVTLADPSAPSTVSFQLSFGAMLGITLFYGTLSGLFPQGEGTAAEHAPERITDAESLPPSPGIPEGEWVGGMIPPGGRAPGKTSLMLTPVLGGLMEFLRSLVRRIWNTLALSLSCQIITAPIVWAVFGTFSQWSLTANLICTPMVGGAMTLSPLCMLLSGVPGLGDAAFLLLDRLLDALRFCAEVMSAQV